MFSLGLLCIALYNSPHRSPIESSGSVSAYKRLFNSSSTIPSSGNGFLSSRPLPRDLSTFVLPRLITRRPAQRMTAKEFQESEYFDNILVSTIRFLDGFPAKTPNEKSQFLRGLVKVLPSFPKSVMEKKVLPALLEEMKDKDLLSLILQNVFKIIELLPSGKRAFGEKVRPRLKEIFVAHAKQPQEKDPARDAGLMVLLENTGLMANNSSGKEFKDGEAASVNTATDVPKHRYTCNESQLILTLYRYPTDILDGCRIGDAFTRRCCYAGSTSDSPCSRLQHHQERVIPSDSHSIQQNEQPGYQSSGPASLCYSMRRFSRGNR